MKKILIIGFVLLAFVSSAIAQKVISGKSKPTRIVLKPKLKRGLPPILFVDLIYQDDNKNGVLEPNEVSVLTLKITNKGKGPAQDLLININDNVYDPDFKFRDGQKIPYLYPGQSAEIEIPINAGFNVKTKEHKLEIKVAEHFGYDMDPAYLLLNTIAYQEPELVFSGLDLVDAGFGKYELHRKIKR